MGRGGITEVAPTYEGGSLQCCVVEGGICKILPCLEKILRSPQARNNDRSLMVDPLYHVSLPDQNVNCMAIHY